MEEAANKIQEVMKAEMIKFQTNDVIGKLDMQNEKLSSRLHQQNQMLRTELVNLKMIYIAPPENYRK